MTEEANPERVGIPFRPILFTLDQVATMLSITLPHMEAKYIHFDGRSIGRRHPDLILARNISPDRKPEWRIAEQELVRWCKRKHFRVVRRGFLLA